jgi:glycosyltransferase involved in cell wall biosynthesis
MRILELVPYVPFPPDHGSRILVFNTVRELARLGHQIILVSLVRPHDAPLIPGGLAALCQFFSFDIGSAVFYKVFWHSLFSGKPYTIAKRWSHRAAYRLLQIAGKQQVDVILADHLHTLQYAFFLQRNMNVPVAYRAHNVETTIWQRYAQGNAGIARRLIAQVELRRIRLYESRTVSRADISLMITPEDLRTIQALNSSINCAVAPSGVDTEYYTPASPGREEDNSLLFIGGLEWHPNEDAVLWFVAEILPLIKKHIPNIRFYVVGKSPPPSIIRLANDFVKVTGYVTDEREYFSKSAVVVIPMRQGGGIKTKALTAMSMAKPIVTTRRGVEGISVQTGKEVLIADDARAFADATVRLLLSPRLRGQMGDRGRELVLRRYNWKSIGQTIDRALQSILPHERQP